MNDWTKDDVENALRFGFCADCGAPRGIKITTLPDSETRCMMMVCTADEEHDCAGKLP